ncbi:hypothetical protein WICPIJ_007038 [Wickerhamomyces pijperi]|uniref:Protein kinase domain-containing protein n=1 Tax=Wickerhamomyces pijperi TaxID=599730 RepID=A0A9P8TJM0_WICPI|nr:hypothetical protein WICPIJ_007038 [Wickerhamomyces pijperi]
MKVYKDAVDFDLIEADKENIQSLREGRSASALKQLLTSSSDEIKLRRVEERQQFEEALREIDELDDPLEPYLQYIKWTNENYPSGATAESGLMSLLERCCSQFQDTAYYKNDPRYLRVWLLYAKCSPTPRDTFIYLFRKEIGTKLALYYEDFANYLESMERYHQADDVFQEGIKQMARPIARLQKRYSEFLERYKRKKEQQAVILANEPKSPVFPARSALQLKSGIGGSSLGGLDIDDTTNKLRKKLEVFNDDKEQGNQGSAVFGKREGWDTLGSNNYRHKENRMDSKPWAGEVLTQQTGLSVKKSISKLAVFKDLEDNLDGPVYKIVCDPSKPRPEKIAVNEDLLYSNGRDDEMDLEMMLMAMKRLRVMNEQEHKDEEEIKDQFTTPTKRRPLQETNIDDDRTPETAKNSPVVAEFLTTPTVSPIPTQFNAVHRMETHPLKSPSVSLSLKNKRDQSPSLAHNKRKKILDETIHLGQSTFKADSPTKTFFTKAAENDIFSFFNQKIEADTVRPGSYQDGDEEEEDEDQQFMYDYTDHSQQPVSEPVNLEDYTEGITTTTAEPRKETEDTNTITSHIQTPIVNPADETLKNQLLELITPPLTQYDGFHCKFQNGRMNMCSTLKKSINLKQARSVFVNFQSDQSTYSLISLLGEGGYASVYLAESMNGDLCAIKAQKPASAWEFFILKQVELRLQQAGQPHEEVLKSIVKTNGLHLYEDESYLILEYLQKGTLLDIVNLCRSKGQQVDETLVIFLTAQLLQIIEALHGIGIIHGDLKPDNCMLRLQDLDAASAGNQLDFKPQSRGVKLIDFGRSIDMQSFPDGVQFSANWATDQQDCPEMREGRPWTYQADYYGVAGIIHTMLFGSFIETVKDPQTERYTIKNHFKRYMKSELWIPLFETLINSSLQNEGKLPINDHIKGHRQKLEKYLQDEKVQTHLLTALRGIETDLK